MPVLRACGACHGDKLPEVHCRSCLHSTPTDGGKWICEGDGKELDDKAQALGCPRHLYIPALVAGEQIDANTEIGWVKYRMRDGAGGSMAFHSSHTLRPYQREAIDTLYDWFSANSGNPLVVIPTAGGKSLIIATFVREAIEQWPDTRILILTHVKELISQNFQELIGFWPDAPAGIYSAGLGKRDLHARIIFAGIQSLHSKAYKLQRVDLVLVDECHLIPRSAETPYGKFLNDLRQINPYLKIVGFTATPFRLDSGLLHSGPDAVFSDIAYEANIRDLIEGGFLAPPVTQRALAQIDTSGVAVRGGEFMAGQLEAAAT